MALKQDKSIDRFSLHGQSAQKLRRPNNALLGLFGLVMLLDPNHQNARPKPPERSTQATRMLDPSHPEKPTGNRDSMARSHINLPWATGKVEGATVPISRSLHRD
jgi:hypothetical protein